MESSPETVIVKFEGKNIDLSNLPANYKDPVAKAKVGDWVGYAYTGEDGERLLGILTPSSQ